MIYKQDISCLLLVKYYDQWKPIARMDFWPLSPHQNPNYKKLKIPSYITKCHHHEFHLNAKIGLDPFFGLHRNVDNAKEFELETNSFRDIFKKIEKHWNI